MWPYMLSLVRLGKGPEKTMVSDIDFYSYTRLHINFCDLRLVKSCVICSPHCNKRCHIKPLLMIWSTQVLFKISSIKSGVGGCLICQNINKHIQRKCDEYILDNLHIHIQPLSHTFTQYLSSSSSCICITLKNVKSP